MADDKTYKVKFKAELENFTKVNNEIQELLKDKSLNLTDGTVKQIKALQIKFDNLVKSFNDSFETSDFGSAIFRDLRKQFTEILDSAKKIGLNILPADVEKRIEKVVDNTKELERNLANAKARLRTAESSITSSGELSEKKKATIFSKTGGPRLDSGSDKIFSGVDDVKNQLSNLQSNNKALADGIKKLESQKQLTSEASLELQKYRQQIEQNNSRIREYTDFLQNYNKAESDLLNKIKNKIGIEQQQVSQYSALVAAAKKEIAAEQESLKAQQENNATTQKSTQIYQETENIKSNVTQITDNYAEALKKEKIAQADAMANEKQAEAEKQKNIKAQQQFKASVDKTVSSLVDTNKQTNQASASVSGFGASTVKAATKIITFASIVTLMKRALKESINTIKDLDKAFTNMAVVTSMSREEAWQLKGTMEELANATGKTTSEIAEITTMYLQQGKSLSQALELTDATARAATIAGISGSQSVNLLTNAMNGFQLSASKAMEVSDKFAALAASSATNYEELATALSKVASQANLAGMSMDFTLGILAKGIETTREAPETIGTALKTVISRMRELTDYESTLEDGTDVNRVEKALGNVGIALRDSEGQFRDLETVLTELGGKWNTLNKNQQANVAVALAGTRQQARLIAMMQDFDRTLELVDESANSYGATLYQSGKYAEGLEAAFNRLTVAWQGFTTQIIESDFIRGIIEDLTNTIKWISDNIQLVLWPTLVIVSGVLLNVLNTKLAEYNAVRMTSEQQIIQNKLLAEAELHAKEQAAQEAKQLTAEKNILITKKEQELSDKKRLLANQKDYALSLKKEKKFAEAFAVENEAQLTIAEIEKDEKELKEEKNALIIYEAKENQANLELKQAQFNLDKQANSELQQQLTTIPLIGTLLSNIVGIYTTINAIRKDGTFLEELSNKKKKIGLLLDKAREKQAEKNYIKGLKEAGTSAATSAGKIPYVGWVIALAILAAIGVSIGVSVAATNQMQNSVEGVTDSLDKQQSQLYELNKSITTVKKLGDEFDNLSSKIIKSAEDLEKLNEIAKQINDEAGAIVVDTSASYEVQQQQIKGYQLSLQAKKNQKLNQMQNILDTGYGKMVYWGKVKYGDDYSLSGEEYLNKLGSSATNALRSIGNNLITQMGNYSQEVTEIMTNAYVSMGGEILENDMDDSIFVERFAGVGEKLEEIVKSGSIQDYANFLDSLTEKQKEAIISGNEFLRGIDKLNKLGAIDGLAKLNLSMEKTNTLFKILQKTSTKTGDALSSQFVEDMKQAEEQALTTGNNVNDELYKVEAKRIEEDRERYKKIISGEIKDEEYEALKSQYESALVAQQMAINFGWNDEQMQEINELVGSLALKMNKFTNADENAAEALNELNSMFLNESPISDYTDSLTKLGSVLENLYKINDKLSLKEQQDILSEYPEALGAIENGFLDASTAMKILNKRFLDIQKDLQDDIADTKLKYEGSNAKTLINSGIVAADFANQEVMRQYYDLGQTRFVENMIKQGVTEENATTLWGDIEAIVQKNNLLNKIQKEGITFALDIEIDTNINSNINKQADQELKLIDKELDLLEEGTEEYANKLTEKGKVWRKKINNNLGLLDNDESQLRKVFGADVSNEDYNAIRKAFNIINSEIIVNADAMEKLTEDQQNWFRIAYTGIEQYAEKQKNAEDAVYESAKSAAEALIEAEQAKTDTLKEQLDKRKELYEDYWDKLDALDEEEERNANRQSLLNQLSALSGGSGSATNSLRKDLLQQLEDLNKEQLDAQKQAQRDALTQSIDDRVEHIDNKMDTINSYLRVIYEQLRQNPNVEVDFDENGKPIFSEQNKITENKVGGIVDYTGYAWVDGTPTKPEAFLNATQTILIGRLAEALSIASTTPEVNEQSQVTIDKIEIHTDQLNTNQDFREAGQILGEEIAAAARRRGINVNVKK